MYALLVKQLSFTVPQVHIYGCEWVNKCCILFKDVLLHSIPGPQDQAPLVSFPTSKFHASILLLVPWMTVRLKYIKLMWPLMADVHNIFHRNWSNGSTAEIASAQHSNPINLCFHSETVGRKFYFTA
jgi:hypothetical protein